MPTPSRGHGTLQTPAVGGGGLNGGGKKSRRGDRRLGEMRIYNTRRWEQPGSDSAKPQAVWSLVRKRRKRRR